MSIKTIKVATDFETTTDPNDCRVWAVCAVCIDTLDTLFIGNTIDSFFEWLKDKNSVCYFHNLKFDGEFIIHYLLTHGYKYTKERENHTFDTLISDDGAWYSITVIFARKNKKYKKAVFYDSLKKLPFKVSEISKAFNLADEKLEIDYTAYRPPGHELTDEEVRYITNDCRIVASALHTQFAQGLVKMTTASDAMHGYKAVVTDKIFGKHFPVLPIDLDTDIRRAYKGGFVYLNPQHKNRRGLQGITLDVNSLYPSVMYDCVLPYGYPMYFEGNPTPDENYPLFIVRLECAFDIKPHHIPTIQLKNTHRFVETEYLSSSDGEIVEMTMTSVDLALMLDHYEVSNLRFISGYKFKGAVGMFKDYIDHWMHIKETSTGAIRTLAKLMLNSLYGKFALNPITAQKVPKIDYDSMIHYVIGDKETRDPVYTAMGAFITANARNKTIRSAQSVYGRFIYADTDSLHLIGYDVPDNLDIHPTRLGAWKHEGNFSDSMFIRAKTYMETVDSVNKVTCAGMPDNVKAKVTYDNFIQGATFTGKLMPRRCVGGVVLIDTTFTIK